MDRDDVTAGQTAGDAPALTFHPKAAESYDERGRNLLGRLKALAPEPARRVEFDPDIEVAFHIPAEELGDLWFHRTMPDGVPTLLGLTRGATSIGLEGEDAREVANLADSMLRSPGVADRVTRGRLNHHVFCWACTSHLGEEERTLTHYVLAQVAAEARRITVWIPIAETSLQSDKQIGRVRLVPMNAPWFDGVLRMVAAKTPEDARPHLEEKIREWRKRLQGSVAAVFTAEAEPDRVAELAYEHTEDALSILRFYSGGAMHGALTCFTAPFGSQPQSARLHFAFPSEDEFTYGQSDLLTTRRWVIGDARMADYQRLGLDHLGAMLLKRDRNDYEEGLLRAVGVFGRAALATDRRDKLLLVVGALEAFLLRDGSEAIQDNVSYRMARVLGSSVDEREAIIKNYKAAYAIRSGIVHHGGSLRDEETLAQFHRNAWAFMIQAIVASQHHTSRIEYLAGIDRTKLQ